MTDPTMETNSPTDTTPAAPSAPAAPAAVSAVSIDPRFVGRMTPEEMERLAMIRQTAQPLMMKIGELEVQKTRILEQILILDGQGQVALDSISDRLGIDKSIKWFAVADGSVFLSKEKGS